MSDVNCPNQGGKAMALGNLLYEEKGKAIGMRVLSSDAGGTKMEVTLQTEGRIEGVDENSLWTYSSFTRPDGSIYGEGKGLMTTKGGDTIHLTGSASAQSPGPGGTILYRGTVHFHTTSAKFSKLNSIAGAFEYDIDPAGNTVAKVWEWK